MPRRIYIPDLRLGEIPLTDAARHHLVDVLRLPDLAAVEPFNATGDRGVATLDLTGPVPTLHVDEILPAPPHPELTIASAVPKGDRADYLVEKLAELGVLCWVPLDTERSVVVPKGESKRNRWERIAQEAARQAHAPCVMQIGELETLRHFVETSAAQRPTTSAIWFCSTGPASGPAQDAPRPGCVVIGPEGGFTDAEEAAMRAAGWHAVTLGPTVLRVETAAVLAAYAAFQRNF